MSKGRSDDPLTACQATKECSWCNRSRLLAVPGSGQAITLYQQEFKTGFLFQAKQGIKTAIH